MAVAPTSSPLRYALLGMVAMAVAMGIGRFVYTPILPGMMEQIGLSASDAGLIASANYLGYLIGALAAAGGWAHGRERALMLCGLGGCVLLAGAMGVTESLVAFLVIRFLAGLASAFVLVFLISIVFSHLALAARSDLQAVHFAGVGLGITLSSAMMALLIAFDADWRAGWAGAALLSALGFAVVAAGIKQGPVVSGGSGREPRLPKDRALFKIIVAYGLFGFGYIVTATFLVAIVRDSGASRIFETMVWLVTGLAALPSAFVWNAIARRTGLNRAFALGCVAEAVGVAASVSLDGHAGPLLAGVLLGGTFVAVTALGLQAGRILAPQSPRRVLALMTAWFGVGQIVGPIAAGFAAEWTGDFVFASAVAALMLLFAGAVGLSAGAAAKSP